MPAGNAGSVQLKFAPMDKMFGEMLVFEIDQDLFSQILQNPEAQDREAPDDIKIGVFSFNTQRSEIKEECFEETFFTA